MIMVKYSGWDLDSAIGVSDESISQKEHNIDEKSSKSK